MSRHIRIHGRPLHVDDPGQQPPPLSLSGDFPNYATGTDYEGRIDIIDSIGMCSVELISGDLPRDYHLYVDQGAKQVVLGWPGFTEVEPVAQIPNGDFQQGPVGWELPAGWAVESYEKPDITPTPAPGNLAAVCRALGRGDHVMQSQKYPCPPGTLVQASGLWDQGPSNKDNVNLFTALAFYDEAGNEILESRGNRIHDETNKRRHTSTVPATSPPGTASVALRNIVHRRNRRNREVIVDDCTWTLTFMSEVADQEYCITIRVRDSAGRTADWSGCISPITIPTYSLLHFDTGFDDDYGIEWEPSANASISTNNPRFGAGCFETLTSNSRIFHRAPEGVLLQDSSTMEGWVRISTYGRVHGFIDIRNHSITGATQQVAIRTMSDGMIRFQDRGNTTAGFTYTHPTPLPLDEWVHVALCFEGEGGTGLAARTGYAFINGELVHSGNAATGLGRFIPMQVYYGYFRDGTVNQYLRGALDEWRIVNGACLYKESFTPPSAPYPM